MIKKRQLVEILWGLTTGDADIIKIRSDPEFIKNSLADGEWIYVKEIEISLRRIFQEVRSGRFEFNGDLIEAILSGKIDDQFQDNKYVLEKIISCQEAIEKLSNL